MTDSKAASPDQREREAAWLQQVAQGGRNGALALEQLMRAYRAKMLSVYLRRGLTRDEVEDLIQDVWIRIARHASDFDPRLDPSPWIWSIAKYLWIDEMRRPRRRHPHVLADDLEGTPDELSNEAANCVMPGEQLDDCVRRGLQRYARIDDEGAWALQLRDLEGWDVPRISQFLKRTEGATRTFLSQVRKKVEPFLKPCFELISN